MSATAFKRLKIYATEALASRRLDENDSARMQVDLADIRAWRFFKAAPQAFLEQYADDFVIVNAHVAENFLRICTDFLEANLLSTLTVVGRFPARMLRALEDDVKNRDVGLDIRRMGSARAVTAQLPDKFSIPRQASWTEILAQAGMPSSDQSPAIYWTQVFKRLLVEDIVPELRIRDRELFFSFMKTLGTYTAKGLNWAAVANSCGISAPCARDWTQYLETIGLVDLIPALAAAAPRRAKMRPKLYWTTPGLALWLSDTQSDPSTEEIDALFENAVYLALKDARPEASFTHFLDTNAVTAQLIASVGTDKHAYYFETQNFRQQDALKSLKSLSKIGLIEPSATCIKRLDDAIDAQTLCITNKNSK